MTAMTDTADIPVDYQWIDWEHLYTYVGRAILGDHVPLMSGKIAAYLETQAKDMRHRATRLEQAASVLRSSMNKTDAAL